jgi:hypothetical protein
MSIVFRVYCDVAHSSTQIFPITRVLRSVGLIGGASSEGRPGDRADR